MQPTNVEDWDLFAQVCQAYRGLSEAFMNQIDMHRGQAIVLCRLVEQDGITQSELAERLAVQGATVTSMVQRMEESGLVIRHRDAEDNRLVRVYVTEKGRNHERAITEQFERLQSAVFAGISPEDLVVLRRVLSKLQANMAHV